MSIQLLYFSATGNTLTTARKLSALLRKQEDCSIIPAVSLLDKNAVLTADKIGLLFPVYYGDMPYFFRPLIDSLQFIQKPYIFAVVTGKGNFGAVSERLNEVLHSKGLSLHNCYKLQMPGNSWIAPKEQDAQALAMQDEQIQKIASNLLHWEVHNYHTEEPLEPSDIAKGYYNMRGMQAEDFCTGCGICLQVCPMHNIMIQDGHAVIGEHCISCMTCFHWCPKKALWMSKADAAIIRRPQYHHPDVSLSDFMTNV